MINTLTSALVIPPPQLIDYEYDSRERRISKKVWNNTTRSANPTIYRRFLHGSWNLIAELDGNNANTLVRSCVWGLDLSGSLQGAGGVSGLLMVRDASQGTYFVAFDLNGNVAGLVSASYGTYTARYEYGPFGELIRATGPMAKLNPFRFSTKYQDDETDLVYYGYRYYTASTGRWLSRDPIGEKGFEILRSSRKKKLFPDDGNLYGFLFNNPICKWDFLGLSDADVTKIIDAFLAAMKDMCDKKKHCDCYGIGPLQDIHASFSSAWGCAHQSDNVEGAIIALLARLDDDWTTDHRRYPNPIFPFYHQDVVVTLVDQSGDDPMATTQITLDPFRGCYTISPKYVTVGSQPKKTCVTCESLKQGK